MIEGVIIDQGCHRDIKGLTLYEEQAADCLSALMQHWLVPVERA